MGPSEHILHNGLAMVKSLAYVHTYVLYKLFSITNGSVEALIDDRCFHICKL